MPAVQLQVSIAVVRGLSACRQGAIARMGRRGAGVVVPHAEPQPAAPACFAARWRPDQWQQGLRGAACRQLVSTLPVWHPHVAPIAITRLLALLAQLLIVSSCKPAVDVVAGARDLAVGAERQSHRA
jgi:hypothetical protein